MRRSIERKLQRTEVNVGADAAGHRFGAGPDSIYIHAVAPSSADAEAVAVCGHPLRPEPPLVPEHARDALLFEELAELTAHCCPDCMSALGIEPGEIDDWRPTGPDRATVWLPRIAGALAAAFALVGLGRFVTHVLFR